MVGRSLKALAASCALIATASAAPAGQTSNSTLWSDGIPPERFQGVTAVRILFVTPSVVTDLCSGPQKPPPGLAVIACTSSTKNGEPIVVMPLPCREGETDYYARIVCHELAHVRGWPATHGD